MKKAPSAANHQTEEIMTVRSLALYLRCTPSTVYRLLRERKIPAFRLGSDWRFFRSAIDAWIASLYETTKPEPTRRRKSKLS